MPSGPVSGICTVRCVDFISSETHSAVSIQPERFITAPRVEGSYGNRRKVNLFRNNMRRKSMIYE